MTPVISLQLTASVPDEISDNDCEVGISEVNRKRGRPFVKKGRGESQRKQPSDDNSNNVDGEMKWHKIFGEYFRLQNFLVFMTI